jgi:hypothetical protein
MASEPAELGDERAGKVQGAFARTPAAENEGEPFALAERLNPANEQALPRAIMTRNVFDPDRHPVPSSSP